MKDKPNAGRRWVMNFATTPMPLCLHDKAHQAPRYHPEGWRETKLGRCISDFVCNECGLTIHIDSGD